MWRRLATLTVAPGALSYQWTHGPQQIYKKIVVSHDSKTLLGGVLVGDASEYATLVQMMLNGISLPKKRRKP